MKLDRSFYLRQEVVQIARDLLGKALFTKSKGKVTGGIIVETEAYSQIEKGSHAYRGITPRNKVMFGPGGISYVYLCYGVHHLFNIVTNMEGFADAVLIRAIEPYQGESTMRRRGKSGSEARIGAGPGKLTKVLGIDRRFNGKSLLDDEVWVEEIGRSPTPDKIAQRKRIGIDYAGKDALLPWRFIIKDHPCVSKP